ncbi:hypothetical protein ACTMU2_30480 [Cupriavidus basilensis]
MRCGNSSCLTTSIRRVEHEDIVGLHSVYTAGQKTEATVSCTLGSRCA